MTTSRDPGGPCPHCADPASDVEKVTAAQAAVLKLLEHVTDPILKDRLVKTTLDNIRPQCAICKGTGFVRVCGKCGGDGVLDKVQIFEEHEILVPITDPMPDDLPGEADIMIEQKLKEIKPGEFALVPHQRRRWMTEGWADGPACGACAGGLVSISKSEVGT